MTTKSLEGIESEKNEKGLTGFVIKNGILNSSFGVIVGAVLTLLGTWYFTKIPHLTYTDGQVVIFKGEKNKFGIATCWIENDGDKEVEGIECVINTHGTKFNEIKVLPDTLSHTITSKNESTRIMVPLLNVGEKLTISVLLENTADLPEQLELSVRGKGAIGSKQKVGIGWRFIISALLFGMLGVLTTFIQDFYDLISGTYIGRPRLKELLAAEKKESAELRMIMDEYIKQLQKAYESASATESQTISRLRESVAAMRKISL